MTILTWNAYFETGIEEVDQQHRHLVDLVNGVAPVLSAADGAIPEHMGDLFGQLLDYAAKHFATEEHLMLAQGIDPRHVDHHLASHRSFVDNVQQFAAAYLDQQDVSGRRLLGFMTNWLVFHILGEDQAMARQLREIGSGMPAREAFDTNGGGDISPAEQALTHALVDIYSLLTEQNRELAARREADIHQLNERNRIVADYTIDWETWVDPSGQYRYCSPACQRLTGYGPQDFIDDPDLLLKIVHPEDAIAVVEHFVAHDASDPRQELIFRIRHTDGEWHWLEHICQPVIDTAGTYLGRRASNRDITGRKRAEEALRQARDQADAANRSQSMFLTNISHELRTPMHGILSFAKFGLAKTNATPEKIRDYFSQINQSAERLLGLLNDLLDLAKLEAGKVRLQIAAHDMAQVVGTIFAQLDGLATQKDLRLQLVVDAAETHIEMDANRITLVIQNLLGNALRFGTAGTEITLRIADAELTTGHHRADSQCLPALAVTVADRGLGIPEAELETIFEKFVQSSTTRTGAGGTGLGLTICREIVTLHGGNIRARNRTDGGAEFTFLLPRQQPLPGRIP